MDVTPELLRQCAQVLHSNHMPPPYCARMTKHGVAFWIWIDENGEAVPPPHTVHQPTVSLP